MMKTTPLPHSASLAAAAFVFTASASLDAADRFWRNEAGGTFSIASNWSVGVPGTGDTAGFSVNTSPTFQGFPYTVGFTANATNQSLRIHDDLVTFDLNTRLYTTTAATGNVIGTVSGLQGRLTITDGTWDLAEASELLIGGAPNATGALTLTVFGNLTDGNIVVGHAGPGFFAVTNGAVANVDSVVIANAPGVTGTAALSGASFWTTTGAVVVGASGHGTFNMNGGQMNCASAVLGAASGSTGSATLVDGRWQLGAGSMIVGNDGDAELNITFTGEVINGNASIGERASAGVVTVDGDGSEWFISGTCKVGNAGVGTLEIKNGGLVQAGSTLGREIASQAGSTGLVKVNTASAWSNAGPLQVGERGAGTLMVESAGLVQNGNGIVGSFLGSNGEAIVSGAGARWNNSGFLRVGDQGTGSLLISQGGDVRNTSGVIGLAATGTGTAVVEDIGSTWSHSTSLAVGGSGDGFLNIAAGGTVDNTVGIIGNSADSIGEVLVEGPGSLWDSSDDLLVGFSGTATLEIAEGGRVDNVNGVVGSNSVAEGDVIVRDPGSLWNNAGLLTVGDASISTATGTPAATLTVSAGGEVRSSGGILGTQHKSRALVTVSDPMSQWINSADLTVGEVGFGELRILNGALVQNKNAFLARQDLSFSIATVDGEGSRWINEGLLTIGNESVGEMTISNGGMVQSQSGSVGSFSPGGIGRVTVKDAGSQWTTLGRLNIVTPLAGVGENRLNVLAGGTVNVGTTLRIFNESTVNLLGGTINIGGLFELSPNVNNFFNFTAGTLRFTGDVLLEDFRLTDILGPSHTIGELQHLAVVGTPTLEGLLRIDGGTFSTGSLPVGAPVDFDSGTFNLTGDNLVIGPGGLFGDTLSLSDRNVNVTNAATIQPGARLHMQGGAFSAGTLINQGTIDFQNQSSQVSGGLLTNTGTVRGSGTILNAIQNNTDGRLQTTSGQRLEFGGTVNNAGLVSLVGGQMQFNAAVTNAASTGLISARDAILRFDGGLTNDGSLAVTFGTADLFGDIVNSPSGRIAVSGGAEATFYEDVTNNGSINISASGGQQSTVVFFGSLSGGGASGGGHVYIEGDARPGASPGAMHFGGDVSFGPFSWLEIEIGGTSADTQYDRVSVASELWLDGFLEVQLIDGFVPFPGQSFDLLDAAVMTGDFAGVLLPPLPPGRFWRADTLAVDGVLAVGVVPATFAEFAVAYGLTEGPQGDDDGDSECNALEYLLGSDPSDEASRPVLSFTRNGQQSVYELVIPELTGTTSSYAIESSADLVTWTTRATKAGAAPWTGGVVSTSLMNGYVTVTLEETDAEPRRFYRARAALE